jgi:four helix bundle protein
VWFGMAAKPRDLRERTFLFSCDVVRFCRTLGPSGVERHVSWQLLKAGTSVGANAEEASAAFTRREFACKNAIVLREARESLFWLRLIVACHLKPAAEVAPVLDEANALVGIFTATVKRARLPRSSFPLKPDATREE